MNRNQARKRGRLLQIAEQRYTNDCGAGVVAVSPDAPQLVLWRAAMRSSGSVIVTDANRATTLQRLHRNTDTLTTLLRADWVAFTKNLYAALRRVEQVTASAMQHTLDTFTLDSSPTVCVCVQTTVRASAP